ncbi:hypothetical protein GPUN_1103 [Glaciecola punicea ACAM 611]|uniref:Uncharacterized protein n=1 Tax=Glaciecola punicea ACAM 611 TaxID=1121923 RepID=H5TAA7_9ALTE|nr:hypothetical protein GPUN_1103 [Glaciecola punicea ACAM 611]
MNCALAQTSVSGLLIPHNLCVQEISAQENQRQGLVERAFQHALAQ